MPAVVPIILGVLSSVGGVAGAVGTGLGIYEAVNQPGAPKSVNPQAVTPQGQNAQKAAVGSQLPTLQSQVGGSVSPEYYEQISKLISGTANQPGAGASAGSAVGSFFGTGGGSTGGPSAGLTTSTGTSSGGLTASGSGNIVSDGIADLFKQFPGMG